MNREIDHCRREVAAVEAELLAGNPDVEGLCLALRDWSAELRILHNEQRGRHAEDASQDREIGGGVDAVTQSRPSRSDHGAARGFGEESRDLRTGSRAMLRERSPFASRRTARRAEAHRPPVAFQ